MKKILLAAIVVLVVAGGFFVVYRHQAKDIVVPASQTTIIEYVPSDTDGLTKVTGTCWENSMAAPYRTDAWRCLSGNQISDPCFTLPNSNAVLCGVDPSGTEHSKPFVLSLTSPLPGPDPDINTDPETNGWLIRLNDGTVCRPFTGTTEIMNDGTSTTYGCNNPSENTVFGNLVDNGSGTWTATVGTFSIPQNSNDLPIILMAKQVAVQTVWQ